MPLVHVALQEGFLGDTVSVRVNGAEVARRANVSTKNQIGFAEAIELDVPEGEMRLELRLENRSLAETIVMRVEGNAHIGVSIDRAGQIECTQSQEPFRYL